MLKTILATSALSLVTSLAFAHPGDVSLANYYSGSGQHAVQYALQFINSGATTSYTGCLSPNGQFDPAGVLTVHAMGTNSGPVRILAHDCVNNANYTMKDSSNFDYQPIFHYQYGCQINSQQGNYCQPG